jgi:uncharacterized protein YkwD
MSNRSRTARMMVILFLSCTTMLSACSGENDDDDAQVFATLEDEVLSLINAHRLSQSLPAFEKATIITTEARKHSQNMASGAVAYGHDGLSARLEVIGQTIPWSEGAENIGSGTGVAAEIVAAWLASSAHKSNIEYSYTKTGIGVAKSAAGIYYYTQIFIKP